MTAMNGLAPSRPAKRPAEFVPEAPSALSRTDLLVGLVDPFLVVPPQYANRLRQREFVLVRLAFFTQCAFWIGLHLMALFLNDPHKVPRQPWLDFRLAVIAMIASLAALGFVGRRSMTALKAAGLLLGVVVSVVMAWVMRLGYPIRSGWLAFCPAFVFATLLRSWLLACLSIGAILYASGAWWGPYHEARFVLSDYEFACGLLLFACIGRLLWISGVIAREANTSLQRAAIEQRLYFEAQLKSFISPVLIDSIEASRRRGMSLVSAIEGVLRRTKRLAAVVYSDFRGYSAKSRNVDFVEKELIPSAVSIVDPAEQNRGVAKQIGDAVLVYYALPDHEESVLRALKDAVRSALAEKTRVAALGRSSVDRYFTLTFGHAYVGNMASDRHREPTIVGDPANLAARIDTLTKEPLMADLMGPGGSILLCEDAAKVVQSFTSRWALAPIELKKLGTSIRSFPDEARVYRLEVTDSVVEALDELLAANGIVPIQGDS